MSERISLSLSPTGGNAAGTVRVTPAVTHEVIAAHMQQARKLRAEAMACHAKRLWAWLTGRAHQAKRDCLDGDWLRPQAAR